MIPVLAQIVQRYLPGHKIEELAKDEVVKAREFSYSAQVYLLMLGQLAHVFSLNELVASGSRTKDSMPIKNAWESGQR